MAELCLKVKSVKSLPETETFERMEFYGMCNKKWVAGIYLNIPALP